MPMYDWICDKCTNHIEELLPISEYDKYNDKMCMQCKSGKMSKVLGSALKIAMRPHEIQSRQAGHQQRIADKIRNIEEKRAKGQSPRS